MEQNFKDFKINTEQRIQEIRNFHENEKQEIKQQHARLYQNLLTDTDQVN